MFNLDENARVKNILLTLGRFTRVELMFVNWGSALIPWDRYSCLEDGAVCSHPRHPRRIVVDDMLSLVPRIYTHFMPCIRTTATVTTRHSVNVRLRLPSRTIHTYQHIHCFYFTLICFLGIQIAVDNYVLLINDN